MKQVGWLDPVNRDDLRGAVLVDGDVLPRPAENSEGAFVGLLERPLHGVYSDEDVGAVFEVLAHERLGGMGARLHRLQALHGRLEAAREVLDAAGRRIWRTAEEFAREPERGPVDELSRGVVEVLLERSTYSEEDQG